MRDRLCSGQMPDERHVEAIGDLTDMYGCACTPKGSTVKVSTMAAARGMESSATKDEVEACVRELAETAAVAKQTAALEYLLSLPSATMASLRREFRGDFDAAASAARSRNLQPLVRS